jgi:hypothetical protein
MVLLSMSWGSNGLSLPDIYNPTILLINSKLLVLEVLYIYITLQPTPFDQFVYIYIYIYI